MSMKEIKVTVKKRKDIILLMIPLIVATLVVALNLIPADILGMFSDAYTVALLLMLLIVTILATRKRASK